jgi:DNA modification methylase
VTESLLLRGEARQLLPTLPECSVALCLTSPNYNVRRVLGSRGLADDALPLEVYLNGLSEVVGECHRVLVHGAVMVLNLPPSIRTPDQRAFPLAAWAQHELFGPPRDAPRPPVNDLPLFERLRHEPLGEHSDH